ncbi:hypothetical protein OUY22_23540 [Nonomuraea sp. MCN248]|uniref:Uncharacterized protein n=1 Tax=Nonomuraea corallina TaxID=2989783 RepID=A0ABT4SGS6_9ACTN|nr:hypothetical protein [Nonomuraea corallina]MDA0636403.1 hypothetical protein [Nonomuraea corallina]
MTTLLSALVATWAGRKLSTLVGLLALLVVVVVALDWALIAFSYFMVLGCAGWEGKLPWLVWRLLPVIGYGSAVGLLVIGIRARR